MQQQVQIYFEQGTLLVQTEKKQFEKKFKWLQWDERSKMFRCYAMYYRQIVRYLCQNKIGFVDNVKNYSSLKLLEKQIFSPREYQNEAVTTWNKQKYGTIVLPTGAGKSYVALLTVLEVSRSTLIVVPTIDLVLQWHNMLSKSLNQTIGLLGGGNKQIEDITVTTYDSARNYIDRLGNQFCLLIFDEVHHLPAPAYSVMARGYIAPYRLGLTATPSEEEDRIKVVEEVCGPVVYSKNIEELSGNYLAVYETKTISVSLTLDEAELYSKHRNIYLSFRNNAGYGGRGMSWAHFVQRASVSADGRRALSSFQQQKQIAISATEKMNELAKILIRHGQERILIFTNDNKTAYYISGLFFLPVITHETKTGERKSILQDFRAGVLPYLVSSRVLNEGVDVPEANVAVVVSGTSVTREHVQRLGRILRKKEDKKAILYELVTGSTGEVYTSKKRRNHDAYNTP